MKTKAQTEHKHDLDKKVERLVGGERKRPNEL